MQPPIFKIPISVLVVIYRPDQSVLLIERTGDDGAGSGAGSGFWQSVTGSFDTLDEPPLRAAQREVWEETGIDTTQPGCVLRNWHVQNIYDIYPQWRHRYAPGVMRNTEHVLGLRVPIDTPVVLSPREHVAYQWLALQDAANLCTSASNAEAILKLPRFF